MQSAFQSAERDYVLLGLHTASHEHFRAQKEIPRIAILCSKLLDTQSLWCIGYPWVFGNSFAARSATVGNVRERGWMEEYSQCSHVEIWKYVQLIASYACERVKFELWVWYYIL
jgi:hypothetical protein